MANGNNEAANESLRRYLSREAKSHLEIIDVDTLEITEAAYFDHLIEAPNWLADGRLLYNSGGLIYTIDPETGAISRIDTGSCELCNNDHVVSFDGKTLCVSCGSPSRIYALPMGGGEPRLVTPEGPSYLHGITPDGRSIAYTATRDGSPMSIYTMPLDGGEETRLTFGPGLDDGPEYSPDGQYIWFNSVRSGLMQLYRMRADGSQATRMTDSGRNDWFAHISPDGKRCAYLSYGADIDPKDHPDKKDVELRIMDADGKNGRTLLRLFGGQGTINVNSWSPDSRKIAYVRYEKE
jgi:TolB protein